MYAMTMVAPAATKARRRGAPEETVALSATSVLAITQASARTKNAGGAANPLKNCAAQ
jgi:hypothetical protein